MSTNILEDHVLLFDSGGVTPKFETKVISKNILFFYVIMFFCVLLLAYVEYQTDRYDDFLRDSVILYWVMSGIFFIFITSFRFRMAKDICKSFKIYSNGIWLDAEFYAWDDLEYITEVGVDYHQGEVATVQSQDHGILYEVKSVSEYLPRKIWVPTSAVFELDQSKQWKKQIVMGRTKKIELGELNIDKPIYAHHVVEKVAVKQYLSLMLFILMIIIFVLIITGALDEAFSLGETAKYAPLAIISVVIILLAFHMNRIKHQRLAVARVVPS